MGGITEAELINLLKSNCWKKTCINYFIDNMEMSIEEAIQKLIDFKETGEGTQGQKEFNEAALEELKRRQNE